MSCGLEDILKNTPVSCINTHHDVTDLLNHEMVKNTKTWISWEWNITFPWNKKILNLCLWWHILRSYCFVVDVTFKITVFIFIINSHNQGLIYHIHCLGYIFYHQSYKNFVDFIVSYAMIFALDFYFGYFSLNVSNFYYSTKHLCIHYDLLLQ